MDEFITVLLIMWIALVCACFFPLSSLNFVAKCAYVLCDSFICESLCPYKWRPFSLVVVVVCVCFFFKLYRSLPNRMWWIGNGPARRKDDSIVFNALAI